MCNTVLPPATTSGQARGTGTVSLRTTPSTTLPAAIGGTCGLICLFATDDDQQPSPVEVTSVAVVNPETNEPYPCFGRFRLDASTRQAALRLLRSTRLPVPRRRLDICAFAARVTGPIPPNGPAEVRWEVELNGTKPETFQRQLEEFHGWISGEMAGKRFRGHACFTEVEKIAIKG